MVARWLLYRQVTSPFFRQGKKGPETGRSRVPVAFEIPVVLISSSILLILFKPSGYVSWKSRKGIYDPNPQIHQSLSASMATSCPLLLDIPRSQWARPWKVASLFGRWSFIPWLALSHWSGVTVFLISTPPDVILGTLKCVHCFSFIAFCLSVLGEGRKTFHLHFPITQITAGQKWVKFGHHRWHKQLRMGHPLQNSENTSMITVPLLGKLELSRNPLFMSLGQTGSCCPCCKGFWEASV